MRIIRCRSLHALAGVWLAAAMGVGMIGVTTAGASANAGPLARPRVSADPSQCPVVPIKAIEGEIAQAQPKARIVVCPGTYHGDLVVTKPVILTGMGATIDATGAKNGITVVASGAIVQGFTVEHATGEGILAMGHPGQPISHVTIRDNLVEHNDQGNPTGAPISSSRYRECDVAGQVPGDCGEGIHLMSATWSAVTGNTVVANSGGILVTDELGPSAHDVIKHNTVVSNLFDCGITIAGHSGKGFANGKTVPGAGGVYHNLVAHNTIASNGLEGQGGGVLLATAVPGGAVYGNSVIGNSIYDSGLAGVTVHSHAPGEDLNGNVVEHNTIGRNNLDGDPDFAPSVDMATTGVIVASAVGPVAITVTDNRIMSNSIGIWWHGPVDLNHGAGSGGNTFVGVSAEVAQG